MSTPAPNATLQPASNSESPAVGVTIENLSKKFGTFEVLKDVSFSVEPGEIFVLMGPSGSGKSVLLKHIVGLELPILVLYPIPPALASKARCVMEGWTRTFA